MLEKSFGLFFFLKQPKNQKSDERYIYLRITVNSISKELSLKRTWNLSRWDQSVGKAKGTKEDAAKLNAYLDVFRANVYTAKSKLLLAEKPVTAELLKAALTGKGEVKRFLLEVFKNHNDEIFKLIGKDYAERTYKRYCITFDHTQAFIQWKYGKADVEIADVNYEFAKDYAFGLKTVKDCNHNTTMYMSTLKTIILECIRKKWLKENPFSEFACLRTKLRSYHSMLMNY